MSEVIPGNLLDCVCKLAAALPASTSGRLAAAIRDASTLADRERVCARLISELLPDNRTLCLEFMRAWRETAADLSGAMVAASMEAAAYQANRLRGLSSVELVWTGPGGMNAGLRSTEQVILDMVRSARKSVYVVAFAAERHLTELIRTSVLLRVRGHHES